jgi:viroplasmin and RNaseH domain-containing protein
MRYRHEGELRQRAERFIEALAQAGIEAAIIPGSFREYSVKVAISRRGHSFGPAIIYYRPKKDSFTMRTHELKDVSIAPELQACWDRPTAPVPAQTGYQVYVDGSCLDEDVGYGLVVLQDGEVVDELCGPVEEDAVQGMRQVAGELRAVQEAIAWCRERSVAEVSLFYDYEGIEKWATGEWRANKPATRAYARTAQDWPIVVHWHKVESHTGNRWNDHADQLAKRGAMQQRAGQDEQEGQEEQDPLSEARDKASQFVEFLVQRGVAASFQGLVNDQFVRVVIGSKQGFLDVYNTRKRPVSDPYLHGFRDPSLKDKVAGLWQEFFLGHREGQSPRDDFLGHASYCYEILRPYRDYEFDFIDLARALHGACEQVGYPSIDTEAVRLDFGELEAIYFYLKGGRGS